MAEVNVEKRRGSTVARREPYFDFWSPGWAGDLIGRSPYSLTRRFTRDLDRLFAGPTWPTGAREEEWRPSMEVFERGGNMVVRADLPGLTKDDVTVEVTDDNLVIQGERKREREEKERGYYQSERSYGCFCRTIALPRGAVTEKTQAEFRNGVLEVSIPVPEAATKGRQVPIESKAG